jgi:hypothetical protein
MATNEEYLDSVIQQANYLRTLVTEGRVPNSISDIFADGVREADSFIDDLCIMVNDEIADDS